MDERLAKLLTEAQRDLVMAPIEKARTLPANAFVSEDWFTLEIERVFGPNWVGVLFDCELTGPGSAMPFVLFGMPLVAVKDHEHTVRVFHNLCPYDGCPVVRHAGHQLDELTVYYHGWRYRLDGQLIDAPYWNGAPDCSPSELNGHDGNLVAIATEVRLGVVFINLDGSAEPIDEWLTPWRKLVDPHYAVDRLVPARDQEGLPLIETRRVESNWKTYQENASINILHEAFTHDLYRKSPEVPRVDTQGEPRFELTLDEKLVAFAHARVDSGNTYDEIRLPSAGHDPAVIPDYGFFTTLFPNINVPLLDSMIKVNLVLPETPGKTVLKHLRFYCPEALDKDNFLEEEQAVQTLFDVVHYEDQLAIEAVQQARHSPAWQQHFYAPFWDTLHHRFNQLVMIDLEKT